MTIDEARGIIAQPCDHPDETVLEACRVVIEESDRPGEADRALDLQTVVQGEAA